VERGRKDSYSSHSGSCAPGSHRVPFVGLTCMRPWIPAALCLVLGAVARGARAEPPPKIAFRLNYTPPAGMGCPAANEFAAFLGSEFGYDPVNPEAQAVLSVDITRRGAHYQAALDARDTRGELRWSERVTSTESCHSLLIGGAASVRGNLGPLSWGTREPPTWIAAASFSVDIPGTFALQSPRPFVPLAPLAPRLSSGESTRREVLPVDVSLGPVLAVWGMPGPALGANLDVEIRKGFGSLGGELRGLVSLPDTIGVRSVPARASLWTGSLVPCFAFSALRLCGLATAGRLFFHLDEPYRSGRSDGLFLGFGARVAADLGLTDLVSLRAYADLLFQVRSLGLRVAPEASTQGNFDDWTAPPALVTIGAAVVFKLQQTTSE